MATHIKIGEPTTLPLLCNSLAGPGQPDPSTDFAKFCELKISDVPKATDGVRICTEGAFVTFQGQPKPIDYPPQYVELTTSGLKLIPIPVNSQYDGN